MSESQKQMISSSMVDLKAELYRKKEEFRNQKASAGFVAAKRVEKTGKPSLWNQKNRGVSQRAVNDEKVDEEQDEDTLAKSRRVLEEKAKLYEKITSSSSEIPEEDGSGYFLVDFQKKAIDSIVSEREAQRRREEEEKEEQAEREALAQPIPEPSTPDEEWVDFTDSLGKSRRCLRKDLDLLLKQDKGLAIEEMKKTKGLMDGSKISSMLSPEEYREKMRQKWEAESEVVQSKEHGQLHYSNVQFDEIRNHGVGFFQFSKDHETREEQLEDLKKMREETIDEKSRRERIKDKRKSMMEARLAKVRQRRKLKDNTAEDEPVKEEETSAPVVESDNLAAQEELKKKQEEAQEAEEKRKNHIRDWDKGKTSMEVMYNNYVDTRRQEREEEFTPPSIYFQETGSRKDQTAKSSLTDKARIQRLQAMTRPPQPSSKPEQFTNNNPATDINTVPPPSHGNVNPAAAYKCNNCVPPPPPSLGHEQSGHAGFSQYSNMAPPGWQHEQYQPSAQQHFTQQPHSNIYPPQWPNTGTDQLPSHTAPQPQHHPAHQHPASNYYNQMNPPPQWNIQSSAYPSSSNAHISSNASQQSQQQPQTQNPSSQHHRPHQAVKHKPSPDTTSRSNQPAVKKKIMQKTSIMDMRYMQNDLDPARPEMATIEAPASVPTVAYTPGSFTAAKQANQEQFEEAVQQSQLMDQISGGPRLYTAEELREKQEEAEAEERVQDFLDSLK